MKVGSIVNMILFGIVQVCASKPMAGCGKNFKFEDYSECHEGFTKCIEKSKGDKKLLPDCQDDFGKCLAQCTPYCHFKCDARLISCKKHTFSKECKDNYESCINACIAKGVTRPWVIPTWKKLRLNTKVTSDDYMWDY